MPALNVEHHAWLRVESDPASLKENQSVARDDRCCYSRLWLVLISPVNCHCFMIFLSLVLAEGFASRLLTYDPVHVNYYYVFLRLRNLPRLFLAITINLPRTMWVWLSHLLPQVLPLRNAPKPKKGGRCLRKRLFSCGLRSSVPRK